MRHLSLMVAAALLMAAPAVQAQEENCVADCPTSRDLNGFTFIRSRLVADPFNTTSVGLSSSYAYASVSPATIPVAGTSYTTRENHLVGMGETLSATVRALSWLSFRGDLASTVFTGSNSTSALAVGAQAQFSGDLGLTLSGQLGKSLRLGFVGTVANVPTIDVTPLGGVLSAARTGQLSDTNILTTTRDWTYSAGVAAAWGIGRAFGIDATLQFQHPRTESGGNIDNSNHVAAGLLAELDLSKITPVGMAFIASWNGANIFQTFGNTFVQQVEGGVYYSARRSLNLGLNVDGRWFQVRPRLDTSAVIVNAVLQYFWQ